MSHRLGLIAGSVGLALAALGFALGPAAAEDKPGEKLTGANAAQALIGNTLVFADEDEVIFLFFGADHALKARSGDESKSGAWVMRGDALCLGDTEASAQDCATYEVAGRDVRIMDPQDNSNAKRGTLLRGNPLEL